MTTDPITAEKLKGATGRIGASANGKEMMAYIAAKSRARA